MPPNLILEVFVCINKRVRVEENLIIRIQPSWEMVVPGPGEMESFLVDVRATATRLADIAHIWQIGNEMQLEGGKYWDRTGETLTAELYVEKYKQIRNAISRSPVLSGRRLSCWVRLRRAIQITWAPCAMR